MSNVNGHSPGRGNYTYDAKIQLPHVNSLSSSSSSRQTEESKKNVNNFRKLKIGDNHDYETPIDNASTSSSAAIIQIENQEKNNTIVTYTDNLISQQLSFIEDYENLNNEKSDISREQDADDNNSKANDKSETDDKPLFVPCPPSKPKPNGKIIRAQVHPKPRHELKDGGVNINGESELQFNQRLPPLESEKDIEHSSSSVEQQEQQQNSKSSIKISSPSHISTPRSKSKMHFNESKSMTRDKKLIDQYKELLNERFHKDYSSESGDNDDDNDDDFSVSVSSLSSSNEDKTDEEEDNSLESQTLTQSEFEPLYSLPMKNRKKNSNKGLNNILISNANVDGGTYKRTGSLPDMRSIVDMSLKKVSHVTKNESEAESEPGAKIGYKFKPLPPIPGTSSNINNSGLYETIDGLSRLSRGTDKSENAESGKRKTFKDIATILTLVPRLTTNSVRSRKNDHRLADVSQYIPDKKLKVFVGTWNMKGTKV